jgi:hypothetical protein
MTWAIDKNQTLDQKMHELIEESTFLLPTNESSASQGPANATPAIEPIIPSDINALLERMSGRSLTEMDKTIQELQKARNFLRNERERMRLEMAEYLRLTQAAMGSAKAVSASVASFEGDIPARNLVGAPGRREAA